MHMYKENVLISYLFQMKLLQTSPSVVKMQRKITTTVVLAVGKLEINIRKTLFLS